MKLYDLKHSSFLVKRDIKNSVLSDFVRFNTKGENDGNVARNHVGCDK